LPVSSHVVTALSRASCMAEDVLFIFLDESGNFDFSANGSAYWSLTALCTMEPIAGRDEMISLLYELAAAGGGQECFHATEDLQSVRDQVFIRINKLPENFEIHSVIAEKRKANPSTYQEPYRKDGAWQQRTNPERLYGIICRTLLKYIFRRPQYRKAKRIVVVLSSLFTNPRQRAIKQVLVEYLKAHTTAQFFIYFHATKADLNCQIADYCGWAIARKWERHDPRSHELIKHHIKSEFDIFAAGDGTKYY
ncbi:MAG: DUF3800 domain-containing protein, partial [Terriglobales bacterium]